MKKVLVCIPPNSAARRDILAGFFRYARQMKDWDIEMASSFAETAQLHDRTVDGIITCNELPSALGVRLTKKTVVVAVAFPSTFRSLLDTGTSFVNCDNEAIGAAGSRHFLGLGTFNSFGFVHMRSESGDARERGFRETLRRKGAACHVFETTFPQSDSDWDEMADWLRNLPKPAAVMAFYDEQACRVLRICRAVGLSVPQEVSVIGVDNDELLCESAKPSLSSIEPDHESVGYAAAEELAYRFRRPSASGRTRAVGSPQVVERESTRFVAPAVCLVRAAVEFIRAHAVEGISVADVARGVGVSRRLLDLRFRQVERQSVLQAIESRRLATARNLLRKTHYSLAEVARRCGYGHVKSFESAFRRKMSMSPGAYRISGKCVSHDILEGSCR